MSATQSQILQDLQQLNDKVGLGQIQQHVADQKLNVQIKQQTQKQHQNTQVQNAGDDRQAQDEGEPNEECQAYSKREEAQGIEKQSMNQDQDRTITKDNDFKQANPVAAQDHLQQSSLIKTFSEQDIQNQASGIIQCTFPMHNDENQGLREQNEHHEEKQAKSQDMARLHIQLQNIVQVWNQEKISRELLASLKDEIKKQLVMLRQKLDKQSCRDLQFRESALKEVKAQYNQLFRLIKDQNRTYQQKIYQSQLKQSQLTSQLTKIKDQHKALQTSFESLKKQLSKKVQQLLQLKTENQKLQELQLKMIEQNNQLRAKFQTAQYKYKKIKSQKEYNQQNFAFTLSQAEKEKQNWRQNYNQVIENSNSLNQLAQEEQKAMIKIQENHQNAINTFICHLQQDLTLQHNQRQEAHQKQIGELKRKIQELIRTQEQVQKRQLLNFQQKIKFQQDRFNKKQQQLCIVERDYDRLKKKWQLMQEQAGTIFSQQEEKIVQLTLAKEENFRTACQSIDQLRKQREILLQQLSQLMIYLQKQKHIQVKEQAEWMKQQLSLSFQIQWLTKEISSHKIQKKMGEGQQYQKLQDNEKRYTVEEEQVQLIRPEASDLIETTKLLLEQLDQRNNLESNNALQLLFEIRKQVQCKLVQQLKQSLEVQRKLNQSLKGQMKRCQILRLQRFESYQQEIQILKSEVQDNNQRLSQAKKKLQKYEAQYQLLENIRFRVEQDGINSLETIIDVIKKQDTNNFFKALLGILNLAKKDYYALQEQKNKLRVRAESKQQQIQQLSRQRSQLLVKSQIFQSQQMLKKNKEEWYRSQINDLIVPQHLQEKQQKIEQLTSNNGKFNKENQSMIFIPHQNVDGQLRIKSSILEQNKQQMDFLIESIQNYSGKVIRTTEICDELCLQNQEQFNILKNKHLLCLFKTKDTIFGTFYFFNQTAKQGSVMIFSLTNRKIAIPKLPKVKNLSSLKIDHYSLIFGFNEARLIWKSKIFILTEVAQMKYFEEVSLQKILGFNRVQVQQMEIFKLSFEQQQQ